MEGKRKYLEDAVRLIDARVAALLSETNISPEDRAAIFETKHLSRLIRTLMLRPYRGDPYAVARKRLWETD